MEYYAVLHKLHEFFKPATYLEVGVRNGVSLNLANNGTLAYGIDPAPDIYQPLDAFKKIYPCTSDEFFERFELNEELRLPIDMGFIDGMHLFEFAFRDFIHMEAICGPNSLIVVHDTYPGDAVVANRERTTQVWCGDVFKLLAILKEFRPDLELLHLDSGPSGILLVKNLDPGSTILRDNYAAIVSRYSSVPFPENKMEQERFFSIVSYSETLVREFVEPLLANRENTSSAPDPFLASYPFSQNWRPKKMKALGILLCYNDGDFLAENIEHLLSQNHHVVTWDHGSTDETSAILDRYKTNLIEKRYVPRAVDFYILYPLMSKHIMQNYVQSYDIISWPDQDEILEGPFRDKSYHEYLLAFNDSPFTWIRFNNMNFWYSDKDGDDEKTTNRVRHYSHFTNCSPRIRAWKTIAMNIRHFNHNPICFGQEFPIRFNLRHYPFRTAEQMRRRIEVDRANLQRGDVNYHYNAMKAKFATLEAFDAAKELHYDDGKELSRIPVYDWMKIYGS